MGHGTRCGPWRSQIPVGHEGHLCSCAHPLSAGQQGHCVLGGGTLTLRAPARRRAAWVQQVSGSESRACLGVCLSFSCSCRTSTHWPRSSLSYRLIAGWDHGELFPGERAGPVCGKRWLNESQQLTVQLGLLLGL